MRDTTQAKRGSFGPALCLFAFVALALSACGARETVPTAALRVDVATGEMKLSEWRVAGPFPAGKSDAAPAGSGAGGGPVEQDYLVGLGRSEARLDAAGFLEIQKGLFNRNGLPADFANTLARSEDGVIRFDKLFRTTKDAVAYAACVVESPEDVEVVLVSGADDALKVWLNGELLLQTSMKARSGDQPVYGNLGRAANFTSARLKKGQNFLLVKVPQLERMWGFNCSLVSLDAARRLAKKNEIYMLDVVERGILPQGASLALDPRLSDLLRTLKLSARVEVLSSKKEPLASEMVEGPEAWRKPLGGFAEGLYYCKVTCPLYSLEEPFYYGDAEAQLASLSERAGSLRDADDKAKINFGALAIRRSHLMEPANRQPQDKTWQAKIVYLVKEFDGLLTHLADAGGRPAMSYTGTHLRGFRSVIDEQVQYYMVHVPESYVPGKSRPPLVVFVPFPLPSRHFLKSVHVANTALINTYVKLAERHGYALLWPFARGNADGAPVAMTDIFEALEAARADYDFDDRRVYLLGWSYGATYALLLGERFPGRFAAIAAAMPPSDLVAFEQAAEHIRSPYPAHWLRLNSPIELAEGLSNTDLYLVHGDEDKNVPVEQTFNFVERCRRLGFEPRFDVIKGMDHVYSQADPTPQLFEFFEGKVLRERPEKVSLATGQLKYGEAYWLKVERLTRPLVIGRLNASLGPGGEITVEAENVGSYEILPERLGLGPAEPLTVRTNGSLGFNGVPAGRPIRVEVEPAPPSAFHKNRDVEGPISHAFAGPFLLVGGSAGPAESRVALASLARQIRETWTKSYFADCPYKEDREVTPQDIADKNLILLGDAQTNSVVKELIASVPLKIEPGYVSVGDRRYDGRGLGVAVVYPNPLNAKRYVVIVGANDYEGFQLSEPNLSQKGWYDFMVWDARDPRRSGPVAQGFWDSAWQRVETVPDRR